MIPQGMRPILALLTIAVGLLVMANYWIGFVETEVDLLNLACSRAHWFVFRYEHDVDLHRSKGRTTSALS